MDLVFGGMFVVAVTYTVVDLIRHLERQLDQGRTREVARRIGERRMMARRASDRRA